MDHGAESLYGVQVVKSEIRNQLLNVHDKGMLNVLISESFHYIVRSLLLLEEENKVNAQKLETCIITVDLQRTAI